VLAFNIKYARTTKTSIQVNNTFYKSIIYDNTLCTISDDEITMSFPVPVKSLYNVSSLRLVLIVMKFNGRTCSVSKQNAELA